MGVMLNCAAATEPQPAVTLDTYDYNQKVYLKYNQPLVSRTVVENGRLDEDEEEEKSELADSDLGLDIFTISGDAQHQPIARWVDQDRLEISFVPGTSCSSLWRPSHMPSPTHAAGNCC